MGASQFLRIQEPRQQAPNSQFQAPKKHQAPSSKTDLRAGGSGICFWGLVFKIWNFSGAWGLVLGVSHSGGSNTEMLPRTLGRTAQFFAAASIRRSVARWNAAFMRQKGCQKKIVLRPSPVVGGFEACKFLLVE
jgi:hypothetical protein